MSFGINGPENTPAIQKSHHTNDGGAGNLGYFQREGKKKKKDEKEESDIFEFSGKKESEDDEQDNKFELDSIGSKIKQFWMNLHSSKEQKNPEEI